MMKRWKTILAGLIGVLVGVVAAMVTLPLARSAIAYFGPPRVTVTNATGGDISDVTVTLGSVRQRVPDMKDGHARTVRIRGHFSECSTHVSWTDAADKHEESAGDYMEGCGFYHATVVLTPERKAKAIYEIKESNHTSDGIPNTLRSIGGRATELRFEAEDETYNCEPHALDYPVDNLEKLESEDLENALREGAVAVAEVAALAHEKSVIDAALVAAGGGDGVTWDSSSDPVATLTPRFLM